MVLHLCICDVTSRQHFSSPSPNSVTKLSVLTHRDTQFFKCHSKTRQKRLFDITQESVWRQFHAFCDNVCRDNGVMRLSCDSLVTLFGYLGYDLGSLDSIRDFRKNLFITYTLIWSVHRIPDTKHPFGHTKHRS